MKWESTPAWRRRVTKALPRSSSSDQKACLVEQIAHALVRYEDLGRGETLSRAMDQHRALLRGLAKIARPLERQLETLRRRLEARHATPDMHSADDHLLVF